MINRTLSLVVDQPVWISNSIGLAFKGIASQRTMDTQKKASISALRSMILLYYKASTYISLAKTWHLYMCKIMIKIASDSLGGQSTVRFFRDQLKGLTCPSSKKLGPDWFLTESFFHCCNLSRKKCEFWLFVRKLRSCKHNQIIGFYKEETRYWPLTSKPSIFFPNYHIIMVIATKVERSMEMRWSAGQYPGRFSSTRVSRKETTMKGRYQNTILFDRAKRLSWPNTSIRPSKKYKSERYLLH